MPTLQSELAGVHGVSVYMPWGTDARRELPVVVGDIFAAFLAAPILRHVWVRFDRYSLASDGQSSSTQIRKIGPRQSSSGAVLS